MKLNNGDRWDIISFTIDLNGKTYTLKMSIWMLIFLAVLF